MRGPCSLLRVVCLLTLGALVPWAGGRRGVSQAQQCVGVGTDGCVCVFDDNSGVIDVASLGRKDGNARYNEALKKLL